MASKKAPGPSKEQKQLAKAQAAAMYDQMAFNREQFGWMKGMAEQQQQRGDEEFAWQRGLAEEARARSNKYDDLYDETSGRQLRKFSNEVDTYDTGAERDKISGRAMVDIEEALQRGQQGLGRSLAARGLNSGSPAAIAAMMDASTEGALAKGAAATMAQEAARREGLQLRAQAAGLGSYTAGLGAGSLGQASGFGLSGLGASGAGLGAAGAAGAGYNQGSGVAQGWGSSANSTYNSIAEQ
ncbi:MAG: hypothetical protein ACRC1H_19215, partial [Caldilineaceae bacterium]